MKRLYNLVFKFSDCLICKGDNQYVFRIHAFLLHQILNLGGHRRGLASTCSCYDKSIILIREHDLPLLGIQRNSRIYLRQDCVQILFIGFQMLGYEFVIVLLDEGWGLFQVLQFFEQS